MRMREPIWSSIHTIINMMRMASYTHMHDSREHRTGAIWCVLTRSHKHAFCVCGAVSVYVQYKCAHVRAVIFKTGVLLFRWMHTSRACMRIRVGSQHCGFRMSCARVKFESMVVVGSSRGRGRRHTGCLCVCFVFWVVLCMMYRTLDACGLCWTRLCGVYDESSCLWNNITFGGYSKTLCSKSKKEVDCVEFWLLSELKRYFINKDTFQTQ